MPKHNNPIPNAHFHKNWRMRVKTFFDQAPKAARRSALRKEKARRAFPRPVGSLRPIVQCPTLRYNSRARLGRGFTFEELSAAKIDRKYARTVGIAVDHRRRNRSEPTFERNVARLLEYKSKLVVFPTKARQNKARQAATPEQIKETNKVKSVLPFHPYPKRTLETRAITEEDKKEKAYFMLRQARADARIVGVRTRRWRKVKAKKGKKRPGRAGGQPPRTEAEVAAAKAAAPKS